MGTRVWSKAVLCTCVFISSFPLTHVHLISEQESKVKLVEQSKAKLWVRTAMLKVSHLMYQYRQAKARLESAEVSDRVATCTLYVVHGEWHTGCIVIIPANQCASLEPYVYMYMYMY